MANTLAALACHSNKLLLQHCLRWTNRATLLFKAKEVRTLYSLTTLGLDTYEAQRKRIAAQLVNIAADFKEKMSEFTADDHKNMVFTEDLKNMLHLAESDDDVELVIKMLKRFNKQNKQLRFGNYVFGPVIMRMFYHLNKPEEAFQCFKSPEMDGLFDQLITYQILMDLLYENKRYNDVLETFKIINDKQIDGIKYAKNVVVLVAAACYKMNTKESLEYMLKLWSDLLDIGHLPMRRAVTFCAMLALHQGKPDVTLEILSSAKNTNYTTIRNMKASALTALGRIDEAIAILKGVLHIDSASEGQLQTFNRDVFEQVKTAVEKLDSPDIKLEFSRIEKYFKEEGHISDITLDEHISQEISTPFNVGRKFHDNWRPQEYNRSERSNVTGRLRYRRDRSFPESLRPGLADLQ